MKKRRATRIAHTHFWDIFRQSNTYDHDLAEAGDFFDVGVKILKVIFYVGFASFTLLGTVFSKLSLIFMTKHYTQVNKTFDVNFFWLCSTLGILCLPHLLTFLRAFLRIILNGERWPAFILVVVVVTIDALNAFGNVLLIAKVFPPTPLPSCVLAMCAASFLPNFLGAIPRSSDKISGLTPWPLFHRAGSLVSFLAQLLLLMFFMAIMQYHESFMLERSQSAYWASRFPNSIADFLLEMSNFWPKVTWHLPVALVCISLSCWENYVDAWILPKRIATALAMLKYRLRKKRSNVNFLSSFVSMIVIVAFGLHFGLATIPKTSEQPLNATISIPAVQTPKRAFLPQTMLLDNASELGAAFLLMNDSDVNTNYTFVFNREFDDEERGVFFALVGSNILGSLCAYYCATLACKLHMQHFSFAFPLTLSTPVSVILAVLIAKGYFAEYMLVPMDAMSYASYVILPRLPEIEYYHIIIIGAILWLPQVLASYHIWISGEERMAKLEKLFLHPMWNAALIEQEFVLGRRNLKSFTLPPRDAVATTEILVTSHISEKDVEKENCEEDGITGTEGTTGGGSGSGEKKEAPPVEKTEDFEDGGVPLIYLCATCWHETECEMLALLKSLFRMDADQTARRLMRETLKRQDADYYEFEGHVFFDDCMEVLEDWEEGGPGKIPNQFVRSFVSVIDQAASEVHDVSLEVRPPTRTVTPYGGRLTWTLPGGNRLIVHLKDKDLIRHKKRWSQVMYMYYLLGYRVLKDAGKIEQNELNFNFEEEGYEEEDWDEFWTDKSDPKKFKLFKGFGRVLKEIPDAVYRRAHNTYILALDGDVDFKPSNVLLLLDRLKKNERVGAACGRIHPVGGGVMVWYQMFEYAVAHWLQKAAEHVLGCVLCSPGCFSLFRGAALMDDDVMKTYTMKSSEARHYIQYDQGEDRWLCTLLLQAGWRVEYCAASDAWTNAPTGMREFFNQRRRWIPSTIANILNLLEDARFTRRVNSTISYLYIVYQVFLLVSTILTPATIVMVIANAIHTVLGYTMGICTFVSALPALFLIVLGFTIKPDNQVLVAAILCTCYALVMASVIVSSIIEISHDTVASPNAAFFFLLSGTTIIAAIMHPREIACLLPALLYLLLIPAGYLILPIYSFCNLHVVSWGTREVKKLTKEEKERMSSGETTDNRLSSWQWFQKMCNIFWDIMCTCVPVDKLLSSIRAANPAPAPSPDSEVLKLLREINGNLQRIVQRQPHDAIFDRESNEEEKRRIEGYSCVDSVEVREIDTSSQPIKRKGGKERSLFRKVLDANNVDDPNMLCPSTCSSSVTTPSGPLHKSASMGTIYFPHGGSSPLGGTSPLAGSLRVAAEVSGSLPVLPQTRLTVPVSVVKQNLTRTLSSEKVDSSPPVMSTPMKEKPWIMHESLKDGPLKHIRSDKEIKFWKDLIARYLYPLEKDANQQAQVASQLKELRNNVVFGLLMGNAIWILILVQLMTLQDRLEPYYIKIRRWDVVYEEPETIELNPEPPNGTVIPEPVVLELNMLKIEPLAFIYLIFFGLILIVQFIAMLVHRWSTVLHLVASCRLWTKSSTPVVDMEEQRMKKDEEADQDQDQNPTFYDVLRFRPANEVLNLIRRMQRPGGFDDDDFDGRSIASLNSLASTVEGLDEEYNAAGRYNVRDYHNQDSVTPSPWSGMPMEQRFQFGAPPPPPSSNNNHHPHSNSINNNNVHFAPHPSVTHIGGVYGGGSVFNGEVGNAVIPSQHEGHLQAPRCPTPRRVSANNRTSTLGLSFHNRLEKIKSVPMNVEQLKNMNRLETQI